MTTPDDDLFVTEDDFTRPRRTNGLTMVIIAALVGVIGFGGGVLAQKSHDAGLVAASGPSASFRARAGGQAGFGSAAPSGQGAPSGRGAASAGEAPAVVGTVTAMSGTRLTVTNFAGKTVAVTIAPTTTVTLVGATALTTGLTASVVGTKAGDGSVSATAVTVRQPGGPPAPPNPS